MDLNKNVQFPHLSELLKNENFGDTTLCLNFLGYGGSNKGGFGSTRSDLHTGLSTAPDDGCRLVLGLGPTSSVCDDYHNIDLNKRKSSATSFIPGLPPEDNSILKLGLSGGTKESMNPLECSLLTDTDVSMPLSNKMLPVVDEGSTSGKKSGGYMPSLLLAPRMDSGKALVQTRELFQFGADSHCHQLHQSYNRVSNSKKCKFSGCFKGAKGATGLCIGHGGGQTCQKAGCNKGAESRTVFCKAHGGGRRCQHLGCTKSAEGKTDFCIAHGGGRRCGFPGGCTKAARGKSRLCIRHGGGKRCKVEGCTRSAEGQAGLCISHGGGRRCQFPACTKGAQGSTIFCKAHGGGKRCIFAGCTKGAEGSTPLCKGHGGGKRCLYNGGGICPKSVHGGTNFCVAHGGGKRCVVPGCTKSARGRTDCCVRHGGGKRCKLENCCKSAQGSTDLCKAHGGGKRCSWGEGKCEKFARGRSGLCAGHSSMLQEREASKGGGLIAPGVFHGLVSATWTSGRSFNNNHSSSGNSVIFDCIDSQTKRQQLIPPQVLVPLTMKSSSSYSSFQSSEQQKEGISRYDNLIVSNVSRKSFDFLIPEGRVHGGGIMSLLNGNLNNPIDGL
ncbi:hypothetical protein F3Y22_tig00110890pilonHSYRG01545 [Hibiscus syriacus]|uniref:WRKY19-like zinc finger domain-containing protein n=1 Tax=Hibiscus syriacus TaxID=106335 RepID=A0A6A2ZK02_HIBSY|nr:hypothetical protein F3Y22_tig00110890pilonHSYRG01545 [Hibiscus syriacus]